MSHKLCVLSGMNSNLNVNLDMSSIKEPQSRLRKWTTVDSISMNTSLDQNSSKHGMFSIPGAARVALCLWASGDLQVCRVSLGCGSNSCVTVLLCCLCQLAACLPQQPQLC